MIPHQATKWIRRLDRWITVMRSVRILCALRILRWQLTHFKRRADELYEEWSALTADGGNANSAERIQ